MNIAFYISNHGYGHLMRELPVAEELLNRGHRVLLVTSEKLRGIAEGYLRKNPHPGESVTRAGDVDVGVLIISGTLDADWPATEKAVRRHLESWPERIREAKELFRRYAIDRVVVDIVPWALIAAKEAGIKSILSTNFTWIEQYEGNLPEELTDRFRACYALPDKVLLHGIANREMIGRYPDGIHVGFFCRPFNSVRIREIKSQTGLPIVYLSVGGSNAGIDFPIDTEGLPYYFISTWGLRIRGQNTAILPAGAENTQDYVAAADFCITKAGWGSIAEEMVAGKRTALIEREGVPEDTYSIGLLCARGEAISIAPEELKDLGAVMRRLEGMKPIKAYPNAYPTVAGEIIRE